MKRLAIALALVLSLSWMAPRPAQAGLVLVAVPAIVMPDAATNAVLAVAGGGIALTAIALWTKLSAFTGWSMMVLAENTRLEDAQIEEALAQGYPFIDSPEAIREVADLLRREARQADASEGYRLVHLPEAELRGILEFYPLAEDQIDQVVSDLR